MMFIFYGCSATPSIPNDFKNFEEITIKEYSTYDTNKNYVIGQEYTSRVGDKIIDNYEVGKVITEKVSIDNVIFTSLIDYKKLIKNNAYKIKGHSRANKEHLFIFIFEQDGFYNFLKVYPNGSLVDNNLYDWYGNIAMPNYIEINNQNIFRKDVYNKTLDTQEAIFSSSFHHELIYNGKSNNSIRVQYREYDNGLARIAFYQDLVYDMKESKTISFKNYTIKIIEATNEHIKFIILSDKLNK